MMIGSNEMHTIHALRETNGKIDKKDMIGLLEAWRGEIKSSADEMSSDHPVQTHTEAVVFILSAILGVIE